MNGTTVVLNRLREMEPVRSSLAGAAHVLRWIGTAIGALLVLVGIILIPLPTPIGLPVIVIGALILVRTSPLARRAVVRWARRHPGVFKRFRRLTRRSRARV